MKILLDSNIFCADFQLEGGSFKIFLEGLGRVGVTCFVPAFVFDEVRAIHLRKLEEIDDKLQKIQKQWRYLTNHELPLPFTRDLVASSNLKYVDYLQACFKSAGIKTLPYPEVSHEVVVQRALQCRKPFKNSGDGYRDSLIWHSVLELLEKEPGRLCFITANKSDFGKAPTLYSDLQSDIKDDSSIELFNTLEKFNVAKIIPMFERLEDLIRRIGDRTFTSFSLHHWIDESIVDAINEHGKAVFFVGLEPDHGSVFASKLKACNKVIVDDVRLLPSQDILVMAHADILLEISVSADWEDFDRYKDIRDFFGGGCSDSLSVDEYVDVEGDIAFTLTLEKDTFKVTWCDFDEIETMYGSVQIFPHKRRDV